MWIKDLQVRSLVYMYSTGETASSHINIIIKDLQVLIKGVDDKPAPPFKINNKIIDKGAYPFGVVSHQKIP
ncbi:MEI2-like protein 5 [Prunus dulcis]|uniref:MEI2-like protein 5 n=1 Tax=Prunus dulcis TaxID=3755 RepID=A0A4Y1QVN9_PRUDU|nr:MEI2-like protein 5 [Prunus dulcis]